MEFAYMEPYLNYACSVSNSSMHMNGETGIAHVCKLHFLKAAYVNYDFDIICTSIKKRHGVCDYKYV